MQQIMQMTASELASRLGSNNEPFLLDVRNPDEVAEWAIPESYNIPLNEIPSRLDEIAPDRDIVTICAAGTRATAAAQFLVENGYNATVVTGGMTAWGAVYDKASFERDELKLIQLRRRGKGCLSYLIGGEGRAFVVDPSLDIEEYIHVAEDNGWQIEKVFDTHLHADHLSGARKLSRSTGAILYLNPADTFDFPYEPLSDGTTFELPGGHHFKVGTWYTPGHTNGSTVFEISDIALLSGDTVFADGVGRPDLADKVREFAANLYDSLTKVFSHLHEDVLILPAHYSDKIKVHPNELVGASVATLRSTLEPLAMTKEQFINWAEEKITPRPPNYAEIIKVNMGKSSKDIELLRHLEAGPNRCSA